MIKAIFFDIDGTLVSFQTHCIPEDAKDALRLAAKNGAKLFIATGRHRREAEKALQGFPFDGFITLNGQYCYTGDTVIRKQSLDPGDLRILAQRLAHDPYPCEFVEDERLYINMIDETVLRMHEQVSLALPPVVDVSRVYEREIFQMMHYYDPSREPAEMAILPNCEATRWCPWFADIVPKGGGKHAGIAAMLKQFAISPEEAMAFGDGDNDISMLRAVAVGVAMGNSTQSVKDAADDVTDSVDEGGIRNALKRHGVI